ncbi:MAG: flagellar protein FlbD [Chitinivibrionales bacterium]|nr:flagellar protein FlbD [Chitinivibrionales bacterium]MBD3394021.1 flagellar protein FlbD [Chitinivibrionales bacterium]
MIALQRLNGDSFVLNSELIETLESTPDTVIKLTTGKTIIARNSVEDIVRKAVKYKQLCNQTLQVVHRRDETEGNQGR